MIPRYSAISLGSSFALSLFAFREVKSGYSSVSALRQDGSGNACYGVFRRPGVPALPDAAASCEWQPDGRLGGGSRRRLARLAHYERLDEHTRLRPARFVRRARFWHRVASRSGVHGLPAARPTASGF
jgi:hypothetical protein